MVILSLDTPPLDMEVGVKLMFKSACNEVCAWIAFVGHIENTNKQMTIKVDFLMILSCEGVLVLMNSFYPICRMV